MLSFSGVPGTSRSKESVATRNIERRTQNTKRTRPEAGDANPLLLYVTICGIYGRQSSISQVSLRDIWFSPVNIVPFYHQCYTILLLQFVEFMVDKVAI